MSRISVVIQTFNEADFVDKCLLSVTWADEIVVVDLESTDDTVERCRRYTDKIVTHPWVPVVELAREFAITQATGDWVLVLDPDESVSEKLSGTLRDLASDLSSADGYVLQFMTQMFRKDILHSGWDKDAHLRFFRGGKCAWPPEVHSNPTVDGNVQVIPRSNGYVIHDNYRSISEFIGKLNRYTDLEAKRLQQEGRPFHWLKLFYQPTREFISRYIRLKGYRDGKVGLMLAMMRAFYVQVTYMKLWEIYDLENDATIGDNPENKDK